jgi:hypothetical protein
VFAVKRKKMTPGQGRPAMTVAAPKTPSAPREQGRWLRERRGEEREERGEE